MITMSYYCTKYLKLYVISNASNPFFKIIFPKYIFSSQSKSDNENVLSIMNELLSDGDLVGGDPSEFFERLQSIQKPGGQGSKTSEAVSQILNCLRISKDFETFHNSSESILNQILPQKINNDRDLYRVYAKSSKNTPTILKIDADISFLEAMSKFKVNFQLDDIIMINLCHQHLSPVR